VLRGRCGVRGSTLALATLVALSAGCVRTDVQGGETVYRYEPLAWIALLAGGGGLALLSLWAYRKLSDSPRLQRYAFLGMILPPLAALGFVPGMVRDQIRVDDNGFVSVAGSLVERTTQAVRFDQLARIQVQVETYQVTSRRGRRERRRQVLVFIRKDGTSEKFYPDILINAAAPDLVARAKAKGVAFVDVEEHERSIEEKKRKDMEEKKWKDIMEVVRMLNLTDQPRKPPKTKGTAPQTAKETTRSTPLVELTDANWTEEVLKSDVPVMVEIYADWVGPCTFLAPTIKELADDYGRRAKVGVMDADANEKTSRSLRICVIPTVLFFQDGREVARLPGLNQKEKYQAEFAKLGVSVEDPRSPNQ
jgi:thioredoxin 1